MCQRHCSIGERTMSVRANSSIPVYSMLLSRTSIMPKTLPIFVISIILKMIYFFSTHFSLGMFLLMKYVFKIKNHNTNKLTCMRAL